MLWWIRAYYFTGSRRVVGYLFAVRFDKMNI